MVQSGMELSYLAGTCPISLPSSCLPTSTYSFVTHPVDSVYSGTQNGDPTSIFVRKTDSNQKKTDDPNQKKTNEPKKGFEKTSDTGLREWAAAQLPPFDVNKEDIEWRTLKHPDLGLILVGIMAGAIYWIGRRKYPAKNSPDFGLRDELPGYYPYGGIDAKWSPCSSIDTEPDSSSDEGPDPDDNLAFWQIPGRRRKMVRESPGHPSVAGISHPDSQLPVIGGLDPATPPDLLSQARQAEGESRDVTR
jgi:hypothetical protein